MSKEELDATKGVMHSILQGVSRKSCYFDTTLASHGANTVVLIPTPIPGRSAGEP